MTFLTTIYKNIPHFNGFQHPEVLTVSKNEIGGISIGLDVLSRTQKQCHSNIAYLSIEEAEALVLKLQNEIKKAKGE